MATYLLRWRIVPVLALILLMTLPIGRAFGQDAGATISVDWPSDGQTAQLGQNVVFSGWAADGSSSGTGIDRVVIYDAPVEAGGQIVAEAVYGTGRSDVGAAYGPAWMNSEFIATWRAQGSVGNRTFWVYAHSTDDDGWTNKTVTVRLTPAMEAAPASVNQPPLDYRSQNPGPNGYPQQNGYDNGQQYGHYGPQYPGPMGSQFGPNGTPFNGQFTPYGNGAQQNIHQGLPVSNPMPVVSTTAGPDGMILLTWYPIPNASQYRIYELAPVASLISSVSQTVGGMTNSTLISGLIPGSPHAYQVRAVTTNGAETIAPASFLITPGAYAGGAPPVTVTVAGQNASSVSLSWVPIPVSGITGYQTSQSLAAAGPFVPSVVSGSGPTGVTVLGLQPNTTYFFQVAAMANNTSSPPSAVISAVTSF